MGLERRAHAPEMGMSTPDKEHVHCLIKGGKVGFFILKRDKDAYLEHDIIDSTFLLRTFPSIFHPYAHLRSLFLLFNILIPIQSRCVWTL